MPTDPVLPNRAEYAPAEAGLSLAIAIGIFILMPAYLGHLIVVLIVGQELFLRW